MSERIRAGNSWVDFYARQRDEVGTEQLPFDPNTVHARYLPTCPNCGQVAEAATDPVPDRCEACWAKLVEP